MCIRLVENESKWFQLKLNARWKTLKNVYRMHKWCVQCWIKLNWMFYYS